jgi:hypothetical protein
MPPVDQGLQVRQVTPLEEPVEDAPVGAVQPDEQEPVACNLLRAESDAARRI